MFDAYENRMMSSGQEKKRDGFPSSGKCPVCGGLLYYASRLLTRDGVKEDVDYCSGGCGFTEKPGARDAKKIKELSERPRTVAE